MPDKSFPAVLARWLELTPAELSRTDALGAAVSTLESLLDLAADRGWPGIERLTTHWGTLEQVYAVALDRGLTVLDDDSLPLVRNALVALRAGLAAARDAATMGPSMTEAIRDRQGLIAFLELVRRDRMANHDTWTNRDLGDYLEAMIAWLRDQDGYYANLGIRSDDVSPWRNIADAIAAARVYE